MMKGRRSYIPKATAVIMSLALHMKIATEI
jgi:hypothetical protein